MRRVLKVALSRLGFTVTFVLLEIVLVLTLLFRLSAYSVYFFVILIALNVISLFAVMNSDGNPEYKLTWICVIVLVPYLGTVMYVLFRKPTITRRQAAKLKLHREKMPVKDSSEELSRLSEVSFSSAGRARSVLSIDRGAAVYTDTASEYFATGRGMWESMLKDLEEASEYIFLEYFIIDLGVMWESVLSVLKKKAGEGVDVRIIYDDVGCISTLPKKFVRGLSYYGIKCVRFSPLSLDVRNMRRNNNRDHRKILVIDGIVAYTGGINIADEYIGEVRRFGEWKDGGVRLFGDAAEGFLRLFLETWELSGGKGGTPSFPKRNFTAQQADGGYYLPFGSGPYPMYEAEVGKRVLLDTINQSKRYVYITTPYLIIDYDLTEALVGAVRRGVDVRIITPGIADKPVVRIMTRGSFPRLLSGGVGIYEYTPGFIHMKSVVSDDECAILGTINLDYRSLVHHFEDAVFIYGTPTVGAVRDDFLETLEVSRKIEKTELRLGLFGWCIKCFVRLFAPLF